MFSQNKDHIEFGDLQRVAHELGENMNEEELKEMMYEANKIDRDGVVTQEDFLNILTNKESWTFKDSTDIYKCIFFVTSFFIKL